MKLVNLLQATFKSEVLLLVNPLKILANSPVPGASDRRASLNDAAGRLAPAAEGPGPGVPGGQLRSHGIMM